eukprot:g634.t1
MSTLKGLKGEATVKVTNANTAIALGSGSVEAAACDALKGNLPEEGMTSVGTAVNVKHNAPTPVGHHVTAKVEVIETAKRDRLLTFQVEVFDDTEMIGSGTHQRFLVRQKKFYEKALSKKKGDGGD